VAPIPDRLDCAVTDVVFNKADNTVTQIPRDAYAFFAIFAGGRTLVETAAPKFHFHANLCFQQPSRTPTSDWTVSKQQLSADVRSARADVK
jgi:hypothetical protein